MHIGSGLNTVSSMYRQQKGNNLNEKLNSSFGPNARVNSI